MYIMLHFIPFQTRNKSCQNNGGGGGGDDDDYDYDDQHPCKILFVKHSPAFCKKIPGGLKNVCGFSNKSTNTPVPQAIVVPTSSSFDHSRKNLYSQPDQRAT